MPRPASYTGMTLGGGRYVLGEMLGKGGFGAVYKAVQADLGRNVAVKILNADAALAGDGLARFAREARAAAALGHPNIAQVSDFQIREGEPPFIVLELLEGKTLGTLLRGQPRLEPGRICAIAHQVLSALDVAHAAGITHRDVKPDNIFLVQLPGLDDFVKLLDFGIAKLSTATTALTDFGTMLGTPAFMAPEQVANVLVDHKSDLYSLGATMYHALSGQHALRADSMSALLYAIVHTPIPPLRDVVPDIDPRLSDVVARAMHKSPAGRFASAAEMRTALEPWTLSAPRAGLIPALTSPQPQQGFETAQRASTFDAGGAPTYPVNHTPSFSVSQAPTYSAPPPSSTTQGAPPSFRGPSFPPAQPMMPYAQVQPAQSRGISGVLMLVGGLFAFFAVVTAAGVIVYVVHADAEASTASTPPAAAGSPGAPVTPGAPAAPAVTPGAPAGTTPRGGVSPAPATPGGAKAIDAGVAPAPTAPGAAPTAPATPPGAAPAAPAAPGTTRMGARSASLTLGDCTFDLSECQAAIGKVMPSVQACFASTEFDPPNHEVADYSISLDKSGNVTDVRRNKSSGAAHAKLDGCVGAAIRRAKYPPSPGNTRVEVLFRARL